MLTEERYFQFAGNVYHMAELFENEQDYCVAEATEFYHLHLKKKSVLSFIKTKLQEAISK